MAGFSKGLIEVGISMVLRDQFSANAGKVSQSFNSMMNDMNTWNRGMQQGIGNAFEYGKQMIGGMYDAYKHFASVNDNIFMTATIAGATAKEQRSLMELAKEINVKTPLTNTDITSGMRYLAMAGNSVEQIENMIEPAAELASIFSMPLGGKGGVADMLTNIMATFGLPADQARQVVDQLGVATTSANINLTDLAQSLQYSGAVFRNAGIGLDQASAAIGVLGNQGIQASSAGTALANMLRYLTLSITGQKAKGEDYLYKLGIGKEDLVDAHGNLKRLDHILNTIAKATEGLSSTDKMEAYYNIFGVRGERAISALVNGGEQMAQIMEKIANSSGFAAEKIAERMKTPQGQIDQFRAQWENLVTTFGEHLKHIFGPLMKGLSWVMGWAHKFAKTGLGGVVIRFTAISTLVFTIINGAKLLFNTFRMISGIASLFSTQTTGANAGMTRLNAQAATLELYLQHIVALMGQYVAMSMAPGTSMVLPGGGHLGRGKGGRVYMNPKGRGGITSPAKYTGKMGQMAPAPLKPNMGTTNTGSVMRGAAGISSFFGPWGWVIAAGLTIASYALESSSSATEENTQALEENTQAMSAEELRATYEERFLKALKETIISANDKGNKPIKLDLSFNGSPYHEIRDGDPVVLDDFGISNGF